MLASLALSSSAYVVPSLAASPVRTTVAAASQSATRGGAAIVMADELSMVNAMSDSFWKAKRARLQAEMEAQLRELEEFEAREKALQQVATGPALSAASAGPSELMALLEAERARSAQLEAMLEKQAIEAENNLQKVSAFWINKVAEAKAQLPAAAEAPALAGAPAAAAKPAAADLVSGVAKEYLEPELSLKELRARLLAKGLSTFGLKAELRARLEANLELDRLQYKSWDSEKLQWN